jgi:ABC-type glutathione transport system ATPase component
MEKKAVFCIIGKSGVGKTTYFDNLMRHIKEDAERKRHGEEHSRGNKR